MELKATLLTADTDEFQRKCQLLRVENSKLRSKIRSRISKAFDCGQITCSKRCELCSVLVAADQLRKHLCAELTEIPCEYCVDTVFTSTMSMREHLLSGVHANMKFYKCSKCTLGFRMRVLLEVHENLDHTHLAGVETETCE